MFTTAEPRDGSERARTMLRKFNGSRHSVAVPGRLRAGYKMAQCKCCSLLMSCSWWFWSGR